MTRMVTLEEMLGSPLATWVSTEVSKKRLTREALHSKMEENREALEKRGVDAKYAAYAVEYAVMKSGGLLR